MAKNDDVILRGKALKDLRGIKDVLLAQGDPFLANIMNRAIECIENQPSAVGANWIPVEERLPEENGRYLCNVKSFAFPGRFYQTILQYDKYGFREGNIYTDYVAHWMELPAEPQPE